MIVPAQVRFECLWTDESKPLCTSENVLPIQKESWLEENTYYHNQMTCLEAKLHAAFAYYCAVGPTPIGSPRHGSARLARPLFVQLCQDAKIASPRGGNNSALPVAEDHCSDTRQQAQPEAGLCIRPLFFDSVTVLDPVGDPSPKP